MRSGEVDLAAAFARLVGKEVEQVWVWWLLRLVFDLGKPGERGTYVDICRFTFIDPVGRSREVDVEHDPIGAGEVLSVLRQRVTAARIEGAWTLELAFHNGARISCPPEPMVEAWQFNDGKDLVVCPPGG